jgi:LacI family transcriptional regulator
MRVTIHDVARQAGVSVKTVSRAINDHPDVSAATRGTVLEAVRALGFRPNAAARGLRSGRSGMIGLLVAEILNPHYAEFARHIQMAAREAGYVLVISNTDYDSELALAEVRTFIANRVDGLIFLTGQASAAVRAAVQEVGLPTVGMDEEPLDGGAYAPPAPPRAHYAAGTYAAASHLIGLGHHRLAYITESLELAVVRERLAAFQRALADHGIAFDPRLVVSSRYLQTHKLEGGYQAMGELLDQGHRPTAVCTSSDLLAMGVLRALRERGLRVPQDVSVVGYDDILEASFADPPLTTVLIPRAAEGAQMLGLLLHRIDPARWPEPSAELTAVLVERASTARAPGSRGTPPSGLDTEGARSARRTARSAVVRGGGAQESGGYSNAHVPAEPDR